MEVIKLENMCHYQDDMIVPTDVFLLQVWKQKHLFLFLADTKTFPFYMCLEIYLRVLLLIAMQWSR